MLLPTGGGCLGSFEFKLRSFGSRGGGNVPKGCGGGPGLPLATGYRGLSFFPLFKGGYFLSCPGPGPGRPCWGDCRGSREARA
eukprot:280102-Chlamydomonas_euryale.AAC.1